MAACTEEIMPVAIMEKKNDLNFYLNFLLPMKYTGEVIVHFVLNSIDFHISQFYTSRRCRTGGQQSDSSSTSFIPLS